MLKKREFTPGSGTVDTYGLCSRNSTAIMASICLRLYVANPGPLCDRFLRFIVRCFFTEKINKLYGRLIARWRHCCGTLTGRWCHRCKVLPLYRPCFYSTRGPTGSLLVTYLLLPLVTRDFNEYSCIFISTLGILV